MAVKMIYPYGITDLKLIDGVWRSPLLPHEDIHHPDYFDAVKEWEKYFAPISEAIEKKQLLWYKDLLFDFT